MIPNRAAQRVYVVVTAVINGKVDVGGTRIGLAGDAEMGRIAATVI